MTRNFVDEYSRHIRLVAFFEKWNIQIRPLQRGKRTVEWWTYRNLNLNLEKTVTRIPFERQNEIKPRTSGCYWRAQQTKNEKSGSAEEANLVAVSGVTDPDCLHQTGRHWMHHPPIMERSNDRLRASFLLGLHTYMFVVHIDRIQQQYIIKRRNRNKRLRTLSRVEVQLYSFWPGWLMQQVPYIDALTQEQPITWNAYA